MNTILLMQVLALPKAAREANALQNYQRRGKAVNSQAPTHDNKFSTSASNIKHVSVEIRRLLVRSTSFSHVHAPS